MELDLIQLDASKDEHYEHSYRARDLGALGQNGLALGDILWKRRMSPIGYNDSSTLYYLLVTEHSCLTNPTL
jgi:hypothetical protein